MNLGFVNINYAYYTHQDNPLFCMSLNQLLHQSRIHHFFPADFLILIEFLCHCHMIRNKYSNWTSWTKYNPLKQSFN